MAGWIFGGEATVRAEYVRDGRWFALPLVSA